MIATMTKRRARKPSEEPDEVPKTTARSRFRYVGLPLDIHEALKAFADADDRTVNGVAKRAIREYLERHRPGECPSASADQ